MKGNFVEKSPELTATADPTNLAFLPLASLLMLIQYSRELQSPPLHVDCQNYADLIHKQPKNLKMSSSSIPITLNKSVIDA